MCDTKKYNPFRPNAPVPPGMFTGRDHELNRIDDSLLKLKEDNPSHLLLVGERGIGKSSLLLFSSVLARGDITWQTSESFRYIPVQFSVDKSLTTLGMIKKIKTVLERQLRKEEKLLAAFQKAWQFLRKVEVAGSKLNTAEDKEQLFDDFVFSLADTCQSIMADGFLQEHGIKTQKDGIILLIDEADNASPELDLGTFLKNLAEALQVEGCNRVLFILSGLPRLRDVLRDSHKSSLRLFEELELLPLDKPDIKKVFEQGVKHVNARSGKTFQIDSQALERMIGVSEGYPHFIQQIGFSTFDENKATTISLETVNKAIFHRNGAVDLIGDRYYRDMYYTNIREDSYREILNIMADNPVGVTTRKQLLAKFKRGSQVLDNGIRALKERNIILPIQGHVGQYRLQWAGFGVWIKFFTQRQ